MKLKIQIKTPKGRATSTEKKLRPFLLGISRKDVKSCETYVSEEDNTIIWDIEATIKKCLKIQKNVSRFDFLITGILENKRMKKRIRSKLTEEQETELKDMLVNHTSCEVIKEATLQEMVEENKTWWEKVKEKFKKKKEED